MKVSTTTSNIRPYNSKQLLFEEEQKKRAAKRDSVLGNLQRTGAAASQRAAAQTKPAAQGGIVQTKPASLVSSGKQNAGGIIQMKPNAFSPNARTANAAAKTNNAASVTRMASTGSTGNLQKPRRTPNMTRGEAWGMLENERKDKRSFSVPSGFSEQGKDVFMQLMELPDLGLDGSESKKHEKVVELKRSVPETSADVKKEAPLSKLTAYGNLGTEGATGYIPPTDEDRANTLKTKVSDLTLLGEIKRDHALDIIDFFRISPSERRSRENHYYNSERDVSGRPIHGQESDPVISQMKYGISTIGKSGCGPIALYNSLYLLGKNPTFANMIYRMERDGAEAWGFFGTDPRAFLPVLDEYGVEYATYDTFLGLQSEVKPGDVLILTYWNNAKTKVEKGFDEIAGDLADFRQERTKESWDELLDKPVEWEKASIPALGAQHHICVRVLDDGKFEIYNSQNDDESVAIEDALRDTIGDGILVYAIHIDADQAEPDYPLGIGGTYEHQTR